MAKLGFSITNDGRKKIAVFSHERSGTHFLMNTIGINFGYLSVPWWNFDFESLTINLHSSAEIQKYFRQFHNKSIINILKSHHPATFFDGILDYITDQFHVFYIYRDPRDALISNWKLIKKLSWEEGPKPQTASEFIRAEPCGGMLRYQKKQERNMLHRWKTNVESWLGAKEKNPSLPMCILRYEDLNGEFDSCLSKISTFIGMKCRNIQRPKINVNVVGSGDGKSFGYKDYLDVDDLYFVDSEIGDLLRNLGYSAG